jgi:putative permease
MQGVLRPLRSFGSFVVKIESTVKINMDINFSQRPFYVKTMCVLVSLITFGYLLIIAKEILSPLIFSCLFSILLLPLAAFIENKLRLPRSAASMLSVILMLSAISLVLYVIGAQLSKLAGDWPQFKEQLSLTGNNLQNWIDSRFNINAARQLNYVHSATTRVLASGTSVFGATVLSLSSILLFLVFTFIYTFFFLLYRSLIMKFLVSVFLEENKELVHDIIEQVQYIIRKYIIGLLIQMAVIAAIVSIVFWALGIKYAFLLGLITGILNVIPYIGIFTALVLSTLITFATATILSKVLLVIIALVVVHLLDSNILLPLVVGSKVRINALITVLGVIIGEMLWGISGMFLSIPVIAVLKIIFDRIESMKPWGIILGDEEKKQNRLAKRLTVTRGTEKVIKV